MALQNPCNGLIKVQPLQGLQGFHCTTHLGTDLDFPIYMGEIRRKIMGLAEVQIWISMNVYKGIGKKNDGSEPKYRFVFA